MQDSIQIRHDAQKIVDLNDLRIFAYVASFTSFSLAADALQIHKSSVSRSIARLEALLKTPLLQRTTRKVLLTQRGVDMRERCVDLLSHVNQAIGFGDDAAPRGLEVRTGIRYANPSPLHERRGAQGVSRAPRPHQ